MTYQRLSEELENVAKQSYSSVSVDSTVCFSRFAKYKTSSEVTLHNFVQIPKARKSVNSQKKFIPIALIDHNLVQWWHNANTTKSSHLQNNITTIPMKIKMKLQRTLT
mmetsp:Transcript_31505/g.60074  ORF Transcript_31505/g.60074 Transcript_31505/m.60074 type:complete len:108 (-) Transcript_31505:615-938(-)